MLRSFLDDFTLPHIGNAAARRRFFIRTCASTLFGLQTSTQREYSRLIPHCYSPRIMSAFDPVRDRPDQSFSVLPGLAAGIRQHPHTIVAPRRSFVFTLCDTALAELPFKSLFTKHRQRRGLVVLSSFQSGFRPPLAVFAQLHLSRLYRRSIDEFRYPAAKTSNFSASSGFNCRSVKPGQMNNFPKRFAGCANGKAGIRRESPGLMPQKTTRSPAPACPTIGYSRAIQTFFKYNGLKTHCL
ncbi:hypothetical protein KCP74_09175 [Salmonella enterica subsp. enterica]|nr:hypothetical protein KCP74_09175 [Salmonella enterica subsp. enterica]